MPPVGSVGRRDLVDVGRYPHLPVVVGDLPAPCAFIWPGFQLVPIMKDRGACPSGVDGDGGARDEVKGLRARPPLTAQVLRAKGQANKPRVIAALMPADTVLHRAVWLVARGLNVTGVNPLRSLHIARDNAPVQVDAQGLVVAFEGCRGADGAVAERVGWAE